MSRRQAGHLCERAREGALYDTFDQYAPYIPYGCQMLRKGVTWSQQGGGTGARLVRASRPKISYTSYINPHNCCVEAKDKHKSGEWPAQDSFAGWCLTATMNLALSLHWPLQPREATVAGSHLRTCKKLGSAQYTYQSSWIVGSAEHTHGKQIGHHKPAGLPHGVLSHPTSHSPSASWPSQ